MWFSCVIHVNAQAASTPEEGTTAGLMQTKLGISLWFLPTSFIQTASFDLGI
jgi:hypothetical protein